MTIPDVASLAVNLQKLAQEETAVSWTIVQGKHGYATILVFNDDGDMIAEIQNQ